MIVKKDKKQSRTVRHLRIRKNLAFNNGISFWCVADNLRIGAALNTVRICKRVIEMGLYNG